MDQTPDFGEAPIIANTAEVSIRRSGPAPEITTASSVSSPSSDRTSHPDQTRTFDLASIWSTRYRDIAASSGRRATTCTSRAWSANLTTACPAEFAPPTTTTFSFEHCCASMCVAA